MLSFPRDKNTHVQCRACPLSDIGVPGSQVRRLLGEHGAVKPREEGGLRGVLGAVLRTEERVFCWLSWMHTDPVGALSPLPTGFPLRCLLIRFREMTVIPPPQESGRRYPTLPPSSPQPRGKPCPCGGAATPTCSMGPRDCPLPSSRPAFLPCSSGSGSRGPGRGSESLKAGSPSHAFSAFSSFGGCTDAFLPGFESCLCLFLAV